MKADLHAYGLVSFSKFWKAWQMFPDVNITDEIYKTAKSKELDLLALTSATEETPTGINDRFGYVLNEAQNQGMNIEVRGDNFLIIRESLGPLGILKSSLVPTIENYKRTDIFILGSYLDFDCQKRRITTKEAISMAKDSNSLVFIKPSGLFGSRYSIEKYSDSIHGIFLSSEASLTQNKETIKRLKNLKKRGIVIQAVPVSGAHIVSGIGDGYINLHGINVQTDSEEELKNGLKYALRRRNFVPGNIKHASSISKLSWGIPFMLIENVRGYLGMNDGYGLRNRE